MEMFAPLFVIVWACAIVGALQLIAQLIIEKAMQPWAMIMLAISVAILIVYWFN